MTICQIFSKGCDIFYNEKRMVQRLKVWHYKQMLNLKFIGGQNYVTNYENKKHPANYC